MRDDSTVAFLIGLVVTACLFLSALIGGRKLLFIAGCAVAVFLLGVAAGARF